MFRNSPATTINDLALPQYEPMNADMPRGAFANLQLERGGVSESNSLAVYAPRAYPAGRPPPIFQLINQRPTMPSYAPVAWNMRQGGYFPLGGSEDLQYNTGALALAGTAGLLMGMLLLYMWQQSLKAQKA